MMDKDLEAVVAAGPWDAWRNAERELKRLRAEVELARQDLIDKNSLTLRLALMEQRADHAEAEAERLREAVALLNREALERAELDWADKLVLSNHVRAAQAGWQVWPNEATCRTMQQEIERLRVAYFDGYIDEFSVWKVEK